jgi:hypothetical protein
MAGLLRSPCQSPSALLSGRFLVAKPLTFEEDALALAPIQATATADCRIIPLSSTGTARSQRVVSDCRYYYGFRGRLAGSFSFWHLFFQSLMIHAPQEYNKCTQLYKGQ